jgi:hypothetical protein
MRFMSAEASKKVFSLCLLFTSGVRTGSQSFGTIQQHMRFQVPSRHRLPACFQRAFDLDIVAHVDDKTRRIFGAIDLSSTSRTRLSMSWSQCRLPISCKTTSTKVVTAVYRHRVDEWDLADRAAEVRIRL